MKPLSTKTTKTFLKTATALSVFAVMLTACSKDSGYTGPDPVPDTGASVLAAAGDSATIVGTINQFRKLLGDPLNTEPGKTGGRREVNWDAVPAAFTNANNFPLAFFNNTDATAPAGRKRGLVLTNTAPSFRVDTTEFSEIDPSYSNQFQTFSKKRLFTPIGSNITGVSFQIPGTATHAFVNGFGVIFSDVDNDNSTTIEYFDGPQSLGVFKVPAHPASGNFSFLGVRFVNAEVTSIKITSGNGPLAAGQKDISDGGTKDLVVMDDFLYNEPTTN